MLFNSPVFLFAFLPIAIIGYYFLLHRNFQTGRIVWLVLVSLFFYSWWNPVYLPLIAGSIVANYYLGLGINNSIGSKRKALVTLGVSLNLGLIAYFKYANFLVDSLSGIISTDFNIQRVILPLAISFFTFQQISYLVDIYKGQPVERKFFNYCLYVSFFPQLIAGPIVRHYEMLPQFHAYSLGNVSEYLAQGFSLFVVGLFKKVVMADSLAQYASPIFLQADNNLAVSFTEAWIAAIAYSFQLYFDFSGYSDMALGLALMFGIKLPINFFSPYKSASIIDFWRNWHITLSRFLKDYLYIPLGGNRSGRLRRYVNLLITMLLGGLWHGASWNFVIWGGIHGFLLMINNIWRGFCEKWIGMDSLSRLSFAPIGILITFTVVTLAWVVFRAETLSGAMNMYAAMFGISGAAIPDSWSGLWQELSQFGTNAKLLTSSANPLPTDFEFGLLMTFSIFVIWFLPNTAQTFKWQVVQPEHEKRNGLQWQPSSIWLLVIASMLIASLELMNSKSEFLYFQF
jgi:alginate O-acetyltransferase complex protein AlgI